MEKFFYTRDFVEKSLKLKREDVLCFMNWIGQRDEFNDCLDYQIAEHFYFPNYLIDDLYKVGLIRKCNSENGTRNDVYELEYWMIEYTDICEQCSWIIE